MPAQIKVPYVDLKGQHVLLKKEILSRFSKLLGDGDFILGKEVSTLEDKFSKYCGTQYAIGVNSGTDALFLAMKALGMGPGDEVITAPNSFLATASSIMATGARIVFADVREDLNIDPSLIEEKITPKTKAIIPVHLTGKSADMDPILELARKHKLHVIEDAAQSIGTDYKGNRTGSFGVVGCFSLHPLKTLNAAGDGGMITTSDENIYRKIVQMRNIGLKNRTESEIWGFNSRLDSLQAAIVNIKFKYLEKWIKIRRKNAKYYRKYLAHIVQCPTEENFERCTYHLFVIQTDRREDLQNYLLNKGIDTKIHYPIPIHLQDCARHLGYKRGDFPVTEKQAERILSVPIHQYLTQTQLDLVAESIQNFFKN